VRRIGRSADDQYVLYEDDRPRWGVTIDWGDSASLPFREELVWPAAGVAVIGGGADVHFLDLETSQTRHLAPVQTYFGHLALHPDDPADPQALLFILACSDILVFRSSLDLLWQAKDVAEDGIVFRRVEGKHLWVGAEMDPPGGWFDVELDLANGAEISRHPAFTDNYQGIYRALV
jgi:hypothetical protein